jgi:hypothetical protein
VTFGLCNRVARHNHFGSNTMDRCGTIVKYLPSHSLAKMCGARLLLPLGSVYVPPSIQMNTLLRYLLQKVAAINRLRV